jgi:hypothetical protein
VVVDSRSVVVVVVSSVVVEDPASCAA